MIILKINNEIKNKKKIIILLNINNLTKKECIYDNIE
jgi:hypothetical protein